MGHHQGRLKGKDQTISQDRARLHNLPLIVKVGRSSRGRRVLLNDKKPSSSDHSRASPSSGHPRSRSRSKVRSASSHREIQYSGPILRSDGQLHDLLGLIRGRDTYISLEDLLRGRDIEPFAPVGHAQCWKGLLKFLRRIMILDLSRNPHWLFGSSDSAQAQSGRQAAWELTNRDETGKSFGGTTFRPISSPVMFESWFPNACFAFRVSCNGC